MIGLPEPRACTTELEHALAYRAVLNREWTGEPFVFYFDTTSLPEAHREDAEHILATVERLSERIEDQIGYPVVEVGGLIEAPVPGPDCDARYRRWRRPGQIVAQVIPELWRDRTGRAVEAIVSAGLHCATIDYWGGYVNTQRDSIIGHELYHLFGFEHSKLPLSNGEPHPSVGADGVGVRMSPGLTGGTEPPHLGVNYHDVDALRCVFPEGG